MSGSAIPTYYWRGEGPLWRVYWLWGVAGSWILAILFTLALVQFGVTAWLYSIAALVMLVYTVWILVSVWRCSWNVREEHWGLIARVLTVAWVLNVVLVGAFLTLDLLGT